MYWNLWAATMTQTVSKLETSDRYQSSKGTGVESPVWTKVVRVQQQISSLQECRTFKWTLPELWGYCGQRRETNMFRQDCSFPPLCVVINTQMNHAVPLWLNVTKVKQMCAFTTMLSFSFRDHCGGGEHNRALLSVHASYKLPVIFSHWGVFKQLLSLRLLLLLVGADITICHLVFRRCRGRHTESVRQNITYKT